jgi:protein gp37
MYREQGNRDIDATIIKRVSDETFNKPKKLAGRQNIFTCSYSDFFISNADDWREDAWKVIRTTPQHIWIIITKRSENIMQRLPEDWGNGYKNVILGVTVESEKYLDRTDILRTIPAASRLVIFEPLISDISNINFTGFDWAIIGGESGINNQYRECKVEWIRNIKVQAEQYNIKVFIKQVGTYMSTLSTHGSLLEELPEDLRIRDYPEIIMNNREYPGLFEM